MKYVKQFCNLTAVIFSMTLLMAVMALSLCSCGKNVLDGVPTSYCEGVVYNDRFYHVETTLYIAKKDAEYVGVTQDYQNNILYYFSDFISEHNIFFPLFEYGYVYALGDKNSPDIIYTAACDSRHTYVSEDFKVELSGKITAVLVDPMHDSLNEHILTKESDLSMVKRLMATEGEVKEYFVSNRFTDGICFYIQYNNCLAASDENLGGYIALTEYGWIYADPKNASEMRSMFNNNDDNNAVLVDGVLIQNEAIIKWIEALMIEALKMG